MAGTETPVALLIVVAVLIAMPLIAFVSRRLRLQYTVAMVVVGLAVSALPVRGNFEVSPALAVTILLPGLVFEAAYRLDAVELRRTFGGVALLAVPGVIVCAAVVAVVLHNAAGLPLGEAFIVGAIVSATDPVAVVATMRQLKAPPRLVTLIDAESLFNDGTAVLVYAIALGALDGGHSLADDAVSFAVGIVASVAIGAAVGPADRPGRGAHDGPPDRADAHPPRRLRNVCAGRPAPPIRDHLGRRGRDRHRDLRPAGQFLGAVARSHRYGLGIPGVRAHGDRVPVDRTGDSAPDAGRRGRADRLGRRRRPRRAGAGGLRAPRRFVSTRPPPGRRATDAHLMAPRHELDRPSRRGGDGACALAAERRAGPNAVAGDDVRDRPLHRPRPGHDRRARCALGRADVRSRSGRPRQARSRSKGTPENVHGVGHIATQRRPTRRRGSAGC